MTRFHCVRTDRTRQQTIRHRCRIGRCPSRAPLHAIDVLSGVSFSMQPMRHCACRPCAIAPCLALHSAPHWLGDFLRVLAHVRVRSNVQMAYPERTMLVAWLAFAGRSAAPCAAPPGHRIPVRSGRGKMQGKIKGRGTALREEPVCTWGWRGTRLITAPCREVTQCLVGIGESVCFVRRTTSILDGGTA